MDDATTELAATPEILVRMYNVGFGDCFLIEFPSETEATVRVLIDCGTIAKSSLDISEVVDLILEDTKDAQDSPFSSIDVVVCTHRHADHVSGFSNTKWKNARVKEVWFPWTEHPTDANARRVREAQSKLAAALSSLWQKRFSADSSPANERMRDIALNALSNESAMRTLHSGFAGAPERLFLSSDGSPQRVPSKALPGISAYVMGPSTDDKSIRAMDPPAGTTYLSQNSTGESERESIEPFAESWHVTPKKYGEVTRWSSTVLNESDTRKISEASLQWDPAITVALEKAVNGTSLVLAFEMQGTVLLFPGDAQWGTWKSLLSHPDTQRLLSKTRFWKVGHHGSHNATPKALLEGQLPPGCCAMMSTKKGKWSSIPRIPLLDAISQLGIPLSRSDEPPPVPLGRFARQDPCFVEVKLELTRTD